MHLPAKSVSSTEPCTAISSLSEAQCPEAGREAGWWLGGDQNPRSQVASACLPCGQLDQTTLKEVATDLGQLCSSVGAVVFWLVATDPDGDQLTYGISGLHANYFSVTSNTGEVKLVSSLDFEVKDGGAEKAWREETGRGWPLESEFWEHGWDSTLNRPSSPCCYRHFLPSGSPSP